MLHIIQVGAGSGGMPVLDMVSRDERVGRVTLIEPDVYKPHNVHRHMFPLSAVGHSKSLLAEAWLKERRPDLEIHVLPYDLFDAAAASDIEDAVAAADLGICAVDTEPAKFHWDALMRRHHKPWTLGEVLSGGIGGFVHRFVPGGPCYGCVASHLQRSVATDKAKAPDYSQPGGAVHEVTIPASKASIGVIAALHAQVTLQLIGWMTEATRKEECFETEGLEFTSLLLTLEKVPDVFDEAYRPYRFRIDRSARCLICRPAPSTPEDLDAALDQALTRLGHA